MQDRKSQIIHRLVNPFECAPTPTIRGHNRIRVIGHTPYIHMYILVYIYIYHTMHLIRHTMCGYLFNHVCAYAAAILNNDSRVRASSLVIVARAICHHARELRCGRRLHQHDEGHIGSRFPKSANDYRQSGW